MILTCPSCKTQFSIDPQKLGAKGRTVRCARCQHQWLATPPLITLPGAADDGVPPPQSPAMTPLPAAEALAKKYLFNSRAVLRNSILAGVAAALVLLAPFAVWRVASLPDTAPSLAITDREKAVAAAEVQGAKGIVLESTPSTRLMQEDGRNMLKIEGSLINRAAERHRLPKLRAQGLNAKGMVIKEWEIPIKDGELEPGQRYPFSFTTPFSEQGVVDIAFHFM